jgi:hypothetical protein
MSEVFESKLTGQRLFKAIDDCVTGDVKWLTQYTNAATAINAYDANQQEIEELKAMVNNLNKTLDEFDRYSSTNLDYLHSPFCLKVRGAIDKTPAQCLQSVKADAIDEAISCIVSRAGIADDPSPELQSHLETCSDFMNYAKQLREGKS